MKTALHFVKQRPWLTLVLATFLLGGGGLIIVNSFKNMNEQELIKGKSVSYLDTSFSPAKRAEELLVQMTLVEKIGQMALVEKNSLAVPADIATYGLGGLLSGAGAKPDSNTAAGWRTMIDDFKVEATKSRLGIPLFYGVDAVHGHALVLGATVFPQQIGLGATGDADLVAKIGQATAQDMAVTGANINYAPNLDLPTDIRWGRVYETFSDDPLLVSRLGSAYVRGLQTKTTAAPVLATLKHFVGVGAMRWDTSTNKNFKIDQGVTEANVIDLKVNYLPPFKAAIEAGALSVMVGLNVWGDTKLITNKIILTDELKTNLGFRGFVVSDWYGVYEGNHNKFLATIRAINAGVDVVMLPFDYKTFVRHMVWANRLGLISTKRIDDATLRILTAKFTLGLFDVKEAGINSFQDNSELARTAVSQSLVLLKNEATLLPLKKSIKHLRVAGSAADNVGLQSGAWTIEWQGVDGNWLPRSTSILAGLKQVVSPKTTIEYDKAGLFDDSETKACVGIAAVGEKPYAEGWGDKAYPTLGNEDLEAIKNLQASCDQVVVVIVSGRPLLIASEIDTWDAVVAAWLPGTEGGGVADVLFGDQNFMGTLPLPWPKSSEQLPITTKGDTADGSAVLFPRYFGLSY